MRLVPRPAAGRAAELDALSLSARSEFLVICFRRPAAPRRSGPGTLELMWSQGCGRGLGDGCRVSIRARGTAVSRLVDHLGFGLDGLRGLAR